MAEAAAAEAAGSPPGAAADDGDAGAPHPAVAAVQSPVKAGGKVQVHFRAAGSAPIMKKNKFKVKSTHPFSHVVAFLRKQIQVKESDSLFVYCSSAFAPAPDVRMQELFECFAVGGELVLFYATTDAWG